MARPLIDITTGKNIDIRSIYGSSKTGGLLLKDPVYISKDVLLYIEEHRLNRADILWDAMVQLRCLVPTYGSALQTGVECQVKFRKDMAAGTTEENTFTAYFQRIEDAWILHMHAPQTGDQAQA